MDILKYSLGFLLAGLGALIAFLGGMLALGSANRGPGPVDIVIGTPMVVLGAFAWGISFRFVPAGWPRGFFFVFLLPLAVAYPAFLLFIIGSWTGAQILWLVFFLLLGVPVWYRQIRRVLKAASP